MPKAPTPPRFTEGAFIGALAQEVGLTVKTIRYYESLGLLAAPERSEAGYRRYGAQDAERLRFIKGAKALGLSLGEIREIMSVWSAGAAPCGHVAELIDQKLDELDRRIERLVTFRDELRAYKAQVDAQERTPESPCKHIQGVAEGRWQPPELDSEPF